MSLAYPPSKDRSNPRDDGTHMVGRHFVKPELGICVIIGPGPVTIMTLPTRAQITRQRKSTGRPMRPGSHHTLRYRQTDTNEEHYSSVAEILQWIAAGPLLQPPTTLVSPNLTDAPIMAPPYVPATIQFVPHENLPPNPALPATTAASTPVVVETLARGGSQRQGIISQRRKRVVAPEEKRVVSQREQRVPSAAQQRVSERAQGIDRSHLTRKQYRSNTIQETAAMFLTACFSDYHKICDKIISQTETSRNCGDGPIGPIETSRNLKLLRKMIFHDFLLVHTENQIATTKSLLKKITLYDALQLQTWPHV
jgi:hypothetical protein